MEEHQKKLVAEQLARKERLAKELRAEKGRLEAMKKEVQALARPDPLISPQVRTIARNDNRYLFYMFSHFQCVIFAGAEKKAEDRNIYAAGRVQQISRRSRSMVRQTRYLFPITLLRTKFGRTCGE